MELNVLNSIVHEELKPWKFDANNTKRIIEEVRFAKSIKLVTNYDLISQLSILLRDYPSVLKYVTKETRNDRTSLQLPSWKAQLPTATTPLSQFYLLLVGADILRVYNIFKQKAENWTEEIDLKYQVGKLLNNIKVLAQQTSTELKEREFYTVPGSASDLTHFSLYCLKQSLVALYMSIQEVYNEFIGTPTTIEDIYMLDLEEPFAEDAFEYAEQGLTPSTSKKLSFGFKGDKDALKTVLTQLTMKFDFVNEKLNTVDQLYQLLTAKEVKPGAVVINIGCETVELRYILNELSRVFTKMTAANIGKSQSLKSKKGTLVNAQLLYSSKIEAPKRKEEIDNILKYLK